MGGVRNIVSTRTLPCSTRRWWWIDRWQFLGLHRHTRRWKKSTYLEDHAASLPSMENAECTSTCMDVLEVPENFGNGELLEVHVRESLAGDWAKMVSILRNAITRAPKREVSSKTVCFGRDRESEFFCRPIIVINILLRYALFGKDDIQFGPGEVMIYRSKKVTILHFASFQWLKDVFTLVGLCSVEFHNVLNGNNHACCGKVRTMLHRRIMVGYIIVEGRDGK